MGLFSHRYRQPAQIEYNITETIACEPGDFMWWNGTTLTPVGISADNLVTAWSSEAQVRRLATARFAGVSNFVRLGDEKFAKTEAIQSGAIYELPCASWNAPKVGDMVGFVKDAGGNYLSRNKVTQVWHPYDAIAYVTKDYSAATTTVECMVMSAYELADSMRSLVKHIPLVSTQVLSSALTIVDGMTFGTRVQLLSINSLVTTQLASASTITTTNGVTALQDTHVLADTLAVGVVSQTLFDHATDTAADNIFVGYGGTIDIDCDATPTGGAASIWLEIMEAPLVA